MIVGMPAATPQVRWIDADRLWQSIMAMAEYGRLPGGGCARLSLGDEDRRARELFAKWCREAGCTIKVDAFGNTFGIRPGRNPALPVVLMGSHLDTQPHGGRFDGVYGVMAGLEVIRSLNDAEITTEAPVAVVNWTNEEGVRFAPGLTGSSAFSGILDGQAVLDIVGQDGARFGDELQRIGFAGDMQPADLAISAYIEPHIEQGPLLEKLGHPVGVVTGVQGVRWYRISVTGADRHAGTTSMQLRQDAFMATSRLALEMRRRALEASIDIRFTIGRIDVQPGSPNTVPGHATFTIDLRHESTEVLDRVEAELFRQAADVGTSEDVRIDVERTMDVKPVSFDRRLVEMLAQTAGTLGLPFTKLVSGAMHDASNIAHMAPTAMLFVPCRNGMSHTEEEWAEPEHLAIGCDLLAATVMELAVAG